MRRFIQLDFSCSHSRGGVGVRGVMASIWDEMMEREKPMR